MLAAAGTNVLLAVATGDAARRRGDARLLLVSLAFVTSAGFLGLHALATPGVLLDAPNTGFVVATPIGLLLAAGFAAASSVELSNELSVGLVRRSRLLLALVVAGMAVWAAVSLTSVPPLNEPLPAERADGWLLGFAIPGIALYALAAARYLRLYGRRPAPMLLGVLTAFVLLAEAVLAIALARNWHATWWEWHLLMLAAFGLVAVSARREWSEERWKDLYLDRTTAERKVSVLFADLEGFTSFSERHGPEAVARMVNEYFAAVVPAVRREGGEVNDLIGDAVMAVFNLNGNEPDHALRAVRAAVALQRAAEPVSRAHPDWPRFRAAVNSGIVKPGVIGTTGGRRFTPVGDAVNLAARLEGKAPAGGVVIGAETYEALPDGTQVEPLRGVQVKGKAAPVEAYVLVDVPPER